MTKPSSAFPKQSLLNLVKPIFITTEALHTARNESSTALSRTTKMPSKLIPIILRLFTTVPSAGTSLANMISLKQIIRLLSTCSLRTYRQSITWEPFEKRWVAINWTWLFRISIRLLICIKIMLHPLTEEASCGTGFTSTLKQFKTFLRLLG